MVRVHSGPIGSLNKEVNVKTGVQNEELMKPQRNILPTYNLQEAKLAAKEIDKEKEKKGCCFKRKKK